MAPNRYTKGHERICLVAWPNSSPVLSMDVFQHERNVVEVGRQPNDHILHECRVVFRFGRLKDLLDRIGDHSRGRLEIPLLSDRPSKPIAANVPRFCDRIRPLAISGRASHPGLLIDPADVAVMYGWQHR
jgi:hypothetical protein